MPLNGDLLGAELKTAVDALMADRTADNPLDAEEQRQLRVDMFKAMGNAIVNHIRLNAEVIVTSVGGVTTGAGTSGPGTGTVV